MKSSRRHRRRRRRHRAPTTPAKIAAQVKWGRHRLDIKSPDGRADQHLPSTSAGRGTASADTPDNAVVTLDKANYTPGEQAKLRIAAQCGGQGDDRAGWRQARTTSSTSISKRATMSCRSRSAPTGARAPMRSRSPIARSIAKAKRMPGRAIGLAWFSIDANARKLDIAIERAGQQSRPRETDETADQARRPRAGRGSGGHRRGGRHRHSQPDPVQDARPAALFLWPAQARRSRSAISTDC